MKVAVIGAGVIGVACAHYLRQAGCEVVLLDKGPLGGGCSHGNCGYICPSHVLPHAGPGVLLPTLLTLLQSNSPLAVRLSVGPSLWTWLARFALRCNRSAMRSAAHAIQALLVSSRDLYTHLLGPGGLEADFQDQGLLFVFHSHHAFDHYAHTDRLLRNEFGLVAHPYHGDALRNLEPALRPEVAGAYHYPCDAQVRPDLLLASWRAHLTAAGVTIREGLSLLGFTRHGRSASRARLSDGDELHADAFVIATGAWTPLLAAELRCSLPIQPGKGYSLTMPRPALCPHYPMIFEEHRVAVSPFRTGFRIGSTMEFAGYDETLNPSRLALLTDAARLYLHDPGAGPIEEQWWGWRPMVPDGLPILGRAPQWANVWLATGHGMLGLSMAPATGRLMAELVLAQPPHLDPHPYAVERFG